MNIELRRFTTNARLSHETTAFAADVWVDGKKVGTAENDGQGGMHVVHLDREVCAQVEAHGKTLVPAEYASFTSGTEWIVQLLLEAELQKRADKSFEKKIAKLDAKEIALCAKQGLGAARFRAGDSWQWLSFESGTDPKTVADAIAAKLKETVDELVVLSTPPQKAASAVPSKAKRPASAADIAEFIAMVKKMDDEAPKLSAAERAEYDKTCARLHRAETDRRRAQKRGDAPKLAAAERAVARARAARDAIVAPHVGSRWAPARITCKFESRWSGPSGSGVHQHECEMVLDHKDLPGPSYRTVRVLKDVDGPPTNPRSAPDIMGTTWCALDEYIKSGRIVVLDDEKQPSTSA